jgi:hypothetical protein
MKNKIDDLIYEIDMAWYNFRDYVLNGLARWCIKHSYTDYPTIAAAMECMTDTELRMAVDDLIAWREKHPNEKLY